MTFSLHVDNLYNQVSILIYKVTIERSLYFPLDLSIGGEEIIEHQPGPLLQLKLSCNEHLGDNTEVNNKEYTTSICIRAIVLIIKSGQSAEKFWLTFPIFFIFGIQNLLAKNQRC